MRWMGLARVALSCSAIALGCGDDDASTSDASTSDASMSDAAACGRDEDCDDGRFCNGIEACVAGRCLLGAPVVCDDGVECTLDLCDETLHRCVSVAPDRDGDGVRDANCLDADGNPLGADCDDDDPDVFPGNIELCNDKDMDCDPTTLGVDGDRDGDGEISDQCCNHGVCGTDCDDTNPYIRTGQVEICDGLDNNCNGFIDESMNLVPWYPDLDGDLFGDAEGTPVESCIPIPEHSLNSRDCDDTRASVSPAGIEVCNGIDDNCNGIIDEGLADCASCTPDPCQNGGRCEVVDERTFFCRCPTGFVGPTCAQGCDVTPAFPAAPDGRANESNHVRDALLFISSQRDDGVITSCAGPCAARFAADGQRCGDSARAPVAFTAVDDVGERWRADWSARGARRIDRIEVYGVRGESAGLEGAEVRVDDFVVAVLPNAAQALFTFDPPLYGSSVEIRKTTPTGRFALAEVEVWGAREAPVTDVAFLGAAQQSSVLATNEALHTGEAADAGAMNAVDGRADTVATTKAFRRAGTLSLEGQVYPFGTGNADDPPLVGRDAAWWWLELGRPQTLRAVQIHRGDTPARLDGAEVYLIVDGTIDATPRWTLPADGAASAIERLRPAAPIANVTGLKIISARDAAAAPGDPDAALELREVRVWADTPARGAESLRDLTAFVRAVTRPAPPSGSAGDHALDGDLTTVAEAQRIDGSRVRFDFRTPHDLRRVDLYKPTAYPSSFLFSPGSGCPSRPLCGDSYGACSFRLVGAEARALDDAGAPLGDALATFSFPYFESFAISRDGVSGVEIVKAGLRRVSTAECPSGYQTEPLVTAAEARVYGYWGAAGPGLLDFAARFRAASITQRPSPPGGGGAAWRAFNLSLEDASATTGVGAQELLVVLARPVQVSEIVIEAGAVDGVDEARLEVLVDGGRWEHVSTLPRRVDHRIVLPPGRLVAAVRLRNTDRVITVRQLSVLARARY